jgi:hypothetical protein
MIGKRPTLLCHTGAQAPVLSAVEALERRAEAIYP